MNSFLWLAFLTAAAGLVWRKNKKKSNFPLPPSPPADPVIGHFRYIPPESPEDQFTEWSKAYGDIIHLRVLHRNMIILNTVEAAIDLLDKRSGNYSDRPYFPVLMTMGWFPALSLLPYGKKFQKHRRLLQQKFNPQSVVQYRPVSLREARMLAIKLIDHPHAHGAMVHRFSSSIIMKIAYGHQIRSDDDPYIKIAENNSYALSHCGPAGGTPIDLFPILRHFPSWFPGAFFAGRARQFNQYVRELYEFPFAEVQRQMAEGNAESSFLSDHLERLHREGNETPEELDDVKGAGAIIYGAGADTTASTLSSFILAMTLYPEVQLRAQKEIDDLLGGSRLPEIDDREYLPFVGCILQETYRWLNAVPLGVPHRAIEDDVYKGMFIPKGSLVLANTRGISMNETVYHDPRKFNPSRFLPKAQGGLGEPAPLAHFGFGRRTCPGRHLADVSLWFAIVTILTLCEIKKAKASDGTEITPEVKVDSGLTSHPKPFQCAVSLRNESCRVLVEQIRVELSE